MKTVNLTWEGFKNLISEHIREKRGLRFVRGQSDKTWSLVTTFHRYKSTTTLQNYFERILPELAERVATLENRRINLKDPEECGSFLAYVRHHGFPTPLLDWTLSPYKAAYHAYSTVDDQRLHSSAVAIFVFDPEAFLRDWKQIYNYDDPSPHVSLLKPKSAGNIRQIMQDSIYAFTNVPDCVSHIASLEEKRGTTYLMKYELPIEERAIVLLELEAMGINAFSLFSGVDGLCRYFQEFAFQTPTLEKTPLERVADVVRASAPVGH